LLRRRVINKIRIMKMLITIGIIGLLIISGICVYIYVRENHMKGKTTIWATLHSNHSDGTETDDVVIVGADFIKKSSPETKTIIAYYSGCLGENIILANALGNFSSLKEARKVLLKNKEHYFENIKIEAYPGILEIDVGKLSVTVTLSGVWGRHIGIDEFKIHKNGRIEYIH
jgi:hypothetical protein